MTVYSADHHMPIKRPKAEEWKHEFLSQGIGANFQAIMPEDVPYEVALKVGPTKWLTFEDEGELVDVLAWLKSQMSMRWPNYNPQEEKGDEWLGTQPYSLLRLPEKIASELGPSLIVYLALKRSVLGVEHDAKQRTRCHGCRAFHQMVWWHRDVRLCRHCHAITEDRWGVILFPSSRDASPYFGDEVEHKHFGRGFILSVVPTNDDYEVVVRFPTPHGEWADKKLLYSFAGLMKVESTPSS